MWGRIALGERKDFIGNEEPFVYHPKTGRYTDLYNHLFGALRMKDETKISALRALCWAVVVILPTGIICWLAHINTVAIIAVALPFMLVAERVFRKLLQVYCLWGPKTKTEQSAPPNGGPMRPPGNSGVGVGPPSVI